VKAARPVRDAPSVIGDGARPAPPAHPVGPVPGRAGADLQGDVSARLDALQASLERAEARILLAVCGAALVILLGIAHSLLTLSIS